MTVVFKLFIWFILINFFSSCTTVKCPDFKKYTFRKNVIHGVFTNKTNNFSYAKNKPYIDSNKRYIEPVTINDGKIVNKSVEPQPITVKKEKKNNVILQSVSTFLNKNLLNLPVTSLASHRTGILRSKNTKKTKDIFNITIEGSTLLQISIGVGLLGLIFIIIGVIGKNDINILLMEIGINVIVLSLLLLLFVLIFFYIKK